MSLPLDPPFVTFLRQGGVDASRAPTPPVLLFSR